MFSLSGNQIMPVFDALLDSNIRLVHVRHEAAAVYMAEAWAQLTGEVGVALVTAGAGFGNALGALLSAQASETPVLLLSGDSPRNQDGMGAFQELDQVAMAAPVTKAAHRADAAETLAVDLAGAIRMARSGRPGPVHLALPVDVLTAHACDAAVPPPAAFVPDVQALGDADAAAVAAFLRDARHPLILTGPALARSRSGTALTRLQKAFCAPVLCMESPRGLRDPSLGAFIDVTRQADRVLLLGKAADFTTGFLSDDIGADGAEIAIIDPDTAEIDRARARAGARLSIAVQADARPSLDRLVAEAGQAPDRGAWMSHVAAATAQRVVPAASDGEGGIGLHPATVCDAVGARLADTPDAVLVCDGGEFGQWAQAIGHTGPRIVNGVSGAIGAAPAYAIAASLARPGAPVFALMGDGTAGFLLAEYETAAREDARFVAVIGNDNCWNAEHQIQIREYGEGRTHSCTLSSAARYDLAAQALGAVGSFVADGNLSTLAQALDDAGAARGPVCVNVLIRPVPAPVVPGTTPVPEAVH